MTNETTININEYNRVAQLCLKDDALESNNKRRGRVRAFSALYLANKAKVCSNVKLAEVALMKDRLARGEAYVIAYQTIFNVEDKPNQSMKNKLKIAFDLLAYINAAELKAKQSLVKIYGDGELITFHESLLELESEIPFDERQWLKSEGKRGTSIDEVLRAGKKQQKEVGIDYPVSKRDVKERDVASNTKGLTLIEALDFISGAVQVAADKGAMKGELLEAASTTIACLTEAIAVSKKAIAIKKAA